MSKKPIIVFEGIEGSGKSHHIKKVANYLKKKKISFLLLREPGGNPNSEKIRKLILDKKSKFNKKTDLLLYLAARNENIQGIITKKPVGDKGFGYDSVFFVIDSGLTFGQMSKVEKDKISHRGLALKKMAKLLKNNIA